MNTELEELRESARIRNAQTLGNEGSKNSCFTSIAFFFMAIVFLPFLAAHPVLKLFFFVFPIMGIWFAFKHFTDKEQAVDAAKEMEKLDDAGKEKMARLEKVVDEMESLSPETEEYAFTFHHEEGSHRNEKGVHWVVKVEKDHLKVLRKPKAGIWFPSREEFRLTVIEKASFIQQLIAKLKFGDVDREVLISPRHYEKYTELIKKTSTILSSEDEKDEDDS